MAELAEPLKHVFVRSLFKKISDDELWKQTNLVIKSTLHDIHSIVVSVYTF